MATYNGGLFLKKQLDSILQQLGVDDEVIISDDGSTDNTREIISSYSDKRIKLLLNSRKKITKKVHSANHFYASSNFENALKCAKNDIVFLSDQDDIWLPNKVKIIISYFDDYDLVMSNFSIIDSEGIILKERFFEKNPISKSLLQNLIKMPFWGCCIAFRKNILLKSLPFPNNTIMHDNWIGILADVVGTIRYVDIPLVLYRRHGKNVSFDKGSSTNPTWFKIYYRIELALKVFLRTIRLNFLV